MDRSVHGETKKLQSLQVILGHDVPQERLQQVLLASNGSVEYALEIFFHQQEQSQPERQNQSSTASTDPFPLSQDSSSFSNSKSMSACRSHILNAKRMKRSPESPGKRQNSPYKQARLDSFFSAGRNDSRVQGIPDRKETNRYKATLLETHDDKMTGSDIPNKKPFPSYTNNLKYNLSSSSSSPSGDACVEASAERVVMLSNLSFERLAELLQQLAETTKRTVKLHALETFICEIKNSQGIDLARQTQTLTCALELVLGGRTSQPLQISGSAILIALQTSLGVSRNQLSKAYRQCGDLGDLAASYFQKKAFFVTSSVRQLSIVNVAEKMEKIGITAGRDAKQHVILSLLRACQSKTEIRFLVRLLMSNMRVGQI
jgi:hypothetical protein